MFLPVLLVRDLAPHSVVVNPLPNVLGGRGDGVGDPQPAAAWKNWLPPMGCCDPRFPW